LEEDEDIKDDMPPFYSQEDDEDPYDFDLYSDNIGHPFDITSKVEQDEIIFLRDTLSQIR
jgi:hypothetical protein